MPDSPENTMRWSAYEHEHVERGSDWFWALGVIAVCAALTSILFQNVIFALVILMGAFVLALIARRPPELHEFEIADRGIYVNGELHTYEHILGFWVETETEDGRPLLLIDTVKFMTPNLVIPIENVGHDEIRSFLQERVPEVPMHEGIAHRILEFFGL
jgi:hypothetical protein